MCAFSEATLEVNAAGSSMSDIVAEASNVSQLLTNS